MDLKNMSDIIIFTELEQFNADFDRIQSEMLRLRHFVLNLESNDNSTFHRILLTTFDELDLPLITDRPTQIIQQTFETIENNLGRVNILLDSLKMENRNTSSFISLQENLIISTTLGNYRTALDLLLRTLERM